MSRPTPRGPRPGRTFNDMGPKYGGRIVMLGAMLTLALLFMAAMAVKSYGTTPGEEQYPTEPEVTHGGGNGGGHTPVGVCHKLGNGNYNYIVVDDDGTYGGHGGHEGDKIGVSGPEACVDEVTEPTGSASASASASPEPCPKTEEGCEPTDPEVTDPEYTEPTDGEETVPFCELYPDDPSCQPDPEPTDLTTVITEPTDPEVTDPGTTVIEPPDDIQVGLTHVCTTNDGTERFIVTNGGDGLVEGALVTGFDNVPFSLAPGQSITLLARVSQGTGPASVVVDGETVASINVVRDLCNEGEPPGETPNPPDRPNTPNPPSVDIEPPFVVNIPDGPDVNIVSCNGVRCTVDDNGTTFTTYLIDLDGDNVVRAPEAHARIVAAEAVLSGETVTEARDAIDSQVSQPEAAVATTGLGETALPETGGPNFLMVLAAGLAGSAIFIYALLRRGGESIG